MGGVGQAVGSRPKAPPAAKGISHNPKECCAVDREVKPLKQNLVAELTAALSPFLPIEGSPGSLPHGVAHAVENLAESILRWRNMPHRSGRVGFASGGPSESVALAQLLDGRLADEGDDPTGESTETGPN